SISSLPSASSFRRTNLPVVPNFVKPYNVIHTGFNIPAKYGRIGKAKVYEFKQTRLNKYYEQKRVEVFYIIEGSKIITVTVYVFYGKWEGIK
ncbi:MAG: hypothetical protein ACOYU0_05320, partial [Nitrospirota bacterium]